MKFPLRHSLLRAFVLLSATPVLATDVIKTWTGTASNSLNAVGNWSNNTRPTFPADQNTDALVYAGAGAGPVNVNVDATAKSITISGPPKLTILGLSTSYDFRGAFALRLGDTFSGTAQPNTGTITNNSEAAVTFTTAGGLFFNFGTLNAAISPFYVSSESFVNIGGGFATTGRNLTVTGPSSTTFDTTIQGAGTQTTAGGHLIKDGSGTLFLNGASPAWEGRILINSGALRINKPASLGSVLADTTVAGAAGTGKLELVGNIVINEALQLGARADATSASIVNVSGNNTLAGTIGLETGGTEYVIESTAGTLNLDGAIGYTTAVGSTNLTLRGDGAGVIHGTIGLGGNALSVIKAGTGVWSLEGPNASTGGITVQAGRLNLNTGASTLSSLSVANGASLAVRVAAPAQSLNATTLNLEGTAGTAVELNVGSLGNPTAPVISAQNVTITGTAGIAVKGSGITPGQIPLIDYTGTLGGAGFAGLILSELPARVVANLVDDTVNTRVVLNVSVIDRPRWTGEQNGDWDANDGTGIGTLNWREVGSGSLTRYLQTTTGSDSVLFDDSASGPTTVSLTAPLTPALVVVDNSTKDYSFTGTGHLTGSGGLTKRGTGTLIISNGADNLYTGTTTIEAGVVRLGDGIQALSGSLGVGPVINNGSIVLNRPDSYTLVGDITGTGSITKLTAGTATLSGSSSFTGLVNINEGTLRLGNGRALGGTEAGTTVAEGAALDLGSQLVAEGEVISASGNGIDGTGVILNTGSGSANVGLKKLILTGPSSLGGTGRWDIRDAPGGLETHGHALAKVGSNSIYLANLGETGIGPLSITGTSSRLVFEGNTTLGNQPGIITVGFGGQLGLEDSTANNTKPIILDGGQINALAGITNVVASPITLQTNSSVNVAASTEIVLSGKISGPGNLAKTTGGILKLTHDHNDYQGTTTISAGPLWIGNDGPTGSLPAGDIIISAGTLLVRRWGELTLNQTISGAGAFQISNIAYTVPQQVTLTGNNTFTGAVTHARGTLRITHSNALGQGSKLVNIQGGRPTLILDGSQGNLDLASGLTFNLSSDGPQGGIQNISGDNVIHGLINLFNQNGGHGRIRGDAGSLTLNGDIRIVPLADHAATTGNRQLQLDGDVGGTINGVIRGPELLDDTRILPLVKDGTGTWTLNGVNTYTGGTTITAGKLKLGPLASIAKTPTIEVQAPATLDVSDVTGGFSLAANQTLRGYGTVQGAVTLPTGSTFSPGTAAVASTFNFANNLTLAGGRVQVSFNSPTATTTEVDDVINVGGDLTFSAPSVIDVTPTGHPLTGIYRLFNYTGALVGDVGTLSFTNPTRYSLSLDTTTPGQVNLVVGGSLANLTWSGNGTTNVWDNTTPASWNTGAETFFHTDAVTFDDSSANTSVTLAGTLLPSSVTVNSSLNYSFNGNGGIGGYSGLTKSGTGTLTINNSNALQGKIKISGGSIVLGVNGRFTATRWIEVDEGSVLDVQAVVAGFTLGGNITDPRVISGRGTLNGNFIVNSSGIISPGDSGVYSNVFPAGDGIGRLTFGGNLTLAAAAQPGIPRLILGLAGPTATVANPLDTPTVEASGSTLPEEHDSISIAGTLALDAGSTIRIHLVGDYVPANGDVFNILDFTTLNLDANADGTAFDPALAVNLELPALPVGLFWNRSLFTTHGLLFISPEPPLVGAIHIAPGDTVNPGAQVTLSVDVTGLEPYTYLWKHNNSAIEGATAPTYVFTADEAKQGSYTVTVTNPAGPTTSAPVVVNVNDQVQFTAHPQNRTQNPGTNVSFSVAATGTGILSYQWRKGGQNIEGATGSEFSLTNITEADQAAYDVVVTNIVGPVPSNAAQLVVNDPASIAQPPVLQGALENGSATFTVTPGGTGHFTYQWRKGTVNIPASNSPSLTLNSLTLDDAGFYSVIVSNSFSSAPSAEARLVVANGTPVVATLSSSQIVATTSNVSLNVLAFGNGMLKYQWYRNNAKINGATAASLTINNVALTHAGTYRVDVTSATTVQSGNTELAVVQRNATSQLLGAGAAAKIEVKAEGASLTYAWNKGVEPVVADGTRIKGLDNKKILEIKPLKAEDTGDYTLVITGPGGSLTSGVHKLTVFSEAPEILQNPPQFDPAIVSGTFTYQIPVNLDPKKTPTAYAATGLPPGLKFDTKNGIISGKPTAVSKDPLGYLVKLTASNGPKSKAEVSGRLVVSAFPANAIGSFVAPIARGPVNLDLGGLFELTTTVTGTFTGKLTLGITPYTLKGVLDATAGSLFVQGRQEFPRKAPLKPLVLTFTLDAATNRVSAAQITDTDGTTPIAFTGWRNKWNKADSAVTAYTAYHTFTLDIPEELQNTPGIPKGNGFGSITLTADGKATYVGKLADGEAITGSSLLGPDGELAYFKIHYTTALKGSVAGSFDLDPQVLTGSLTWWRPANLAVSNRTYHNGFPQVVDLGARGGRYALTAGKVFLNVDAGSAAKLTFADAGIEASITTPEISLTIAAKSKAVLPVNAAINPRKPTLTLTDKTGLIKGAFNLEDNNPVPNGKPALIKRTVTFEGIAIPEGNVIRAYGFYLLPQLPSEVTPVSTSTPILSGQVILEPVLSLP
ncbi:MAG: autotransporter-associated beta strand repeat-containing protein [Verrucomicrobiota bacterium]